MCNLNGHIKRTLPGMVLLLFLLAVALSLPVPVLLAQNNSPEEANIEATGVASYYDSDPARSREEGLEAAMRDAVEQASGVFISSESEMRNFELVSDEVLTRSKGFIKSYEVTKEGRDGPMYNVTIKAVVVKKAFIKDVGDSLATLYQRVGMPRVMLVIEEIETPPVGAEGFGTPAQTSAALNVIEKEVRKILLQQDFTFVDARALTRGSMVEKANKGTDTSRNSILDEARTTKAEIIMLGRGKISEFSKLNKFNVVNANVGLDVIRTDNGQVMASDIANGKGLHINKDTAAVTALQKAAQDLTPKIMSQVSYLWIKEKSQGSRIEMVVKNASFGGVLKLRKALSNEVKGVQKVNQKSFSQGTALLEIISKDNSQRLAESLFTQEFDGFFLEIEDVSSTTMVVTMKNK